MSTITEEAMLAMAGMLSHVIPENDDPDDYDIIRGSIDMLRALAAERAQQTIVPDGWKLVPIEHTDAMIEAICRTHCGRSKWPDDYGKAAQELRLSYASEAYRAMLAAAPSPEKDNG